MVNLTIPDPVATEGTNKKTLKTHFFLSISFLLSFNFCIYFYPEMLCGPLYGGSVPPDAALTELHVLNLDAVYPLEMQPGLFSGRFYFHDGK